MDRYSILFSWILLKRCPDSLSRNTYCSIYRHYKNCNHNYWCVNTLVLHLRRLERICEKPQNCIIPIAWAKFTKTSESEDPLLKGSPCTQGEPNGRVARFPSRSGGNLQEGGNCKPCPRDWYDISPSVNPTRPANRYNPIGYNSLH